MFRRVGVEERKASSGGSEDLVGSGSGGPSASSSAVVRVLEARLDDDVESDGGGGKSSPSGSRKRPRLALRVLGSRNVPGDELWGVDRKSGGGSGTSSTGGGFSPVGARETKDAPAAQSSSGGRATARARMLRRARAGGVSGTRPTNITSTAATGTAKKTTPFAAPRAPVPIMDPLSRAVDSSLLSCLARRGGGVLPHLNYLRTDPSVAGCIDPSKFRSLLNHASSDGSGTVLHAAALLNDPEGAIAALDMGADPSAADGLGRTTAEVAMMAGSEAVTRALEAREGSRGRASGEDGEGEDDDSNYVYEVYRLETSSVGDYGEAGDTETAVGASEVDGDRTAVCDSDGNGKGHLHRRDGDRQEDHAVRRPPRSRAHNGPPLPGGRLVPPLLPRPPRGRRSTPPELPPHRPIRRGMHRSLEVPLPAEPRVVGRVRDGAARRGLAERPRGRDRGAGHGG